MNHITRNHLRVTKSQFGTGFILTGAAPSRCDAQVMNIQAAYFTKAARKAPNMGEIFNTHDMIPSFWEAEHLGCSPLPTCSACKNCPDCRYRSEHLTAAERAVVDEMSASVELTDGKPPIKIKYPFNEFAQIQKSNHKQAIAVQKSHEKRII